MVQHIKKLNLKLALSIGLVLVIFMTVDLTLAIRNARRTSLSEIERWSLLLAETVRVSMNTLMKEQKMPARFEMFDSIRLEIKGLERVRVIRSPRVNEIFERANEERDIPIEREAIADYRKEIQALREKLPQIQDTLEQQDIKNSIAIAMDGIADAENRIKELRSVKTDLRELPVSELDHRVLSTGKPIFHTEGDMLQVWAPYIARKTCGEASGCHSGVNEGEVLGAVHMQFSLAQINQDIERDALFAAISKILLGFAIIGILMATIHLVVLRNIHTIHRALKKFSSGDLSGRIKIRGRDEVQQLSQGINAFIDRFCEMMDEVKQEKKSAVENEERLRVVIENAGEGIITFDAAGVVQSFNSAAEVIFRVVAHDAIGRSINEFVPGLLEGGVGERDVTGLRENGEPFPAEVSVRGAHMLQVAQYVCTLRDITERKDAEKRLNQMANFDSLTGLPNRNLFKDRLSQAMIRADRNNALAALLFLDLDRFKTINDTLGHEAGDRLLQDVASILTGVLRKSDTVAHPGADDGHEEGSEATIARLGGDEFTVIIEGFRKVEYVAGIAQKIIDAMARPFNLAGQELYVSVSIGIAIYPLDDAEQASLIRDADSAMYRAKELGRNTYQFFTRDLNNKVGDRFRLDRDLRRALDAGEFILHYQPKVDVVTEEVIGAEALLRWQRPGEGLVLPEKFIPALEDTGLIIPVGEWVLRTACEQSRAWQALGLPSVRIAVNLSGRQMMQKDVVESITRTLVATGTDAQQLEFELTESMLMAHSDANISIVNELANRGFLVSIDDFGTGYSSLSYLKRFSIHALKIDQSFVRDIAGNQEDAAIATAIVALATSLRLNVIAEGVENHEQLEVLRAIGCRYAQGWLFGQPMEAADFAAWLQNHGRRHPTPP